MLLCKEVLSHIVTVVAVGKLLPIFAGSSFIHFVGFNGELLRPVRQSHRATTIITFLLCALRPFDGTPHYNLASVSRCFSWLQGWATETIHPGLGHVAMYVSVSSGNLGISGIWRPFKYLEKLMILKALWSQISPHSCESCAILKSILYSRSLSKNEE